MTRAFYIGRFQPYHNGHQYVLEKIAGTADAIVIGVGSAQLSHEKENPFTAGERILMITESLKDIRVPLYVIPIEDIKRNALWVAHVRSMVPPFDIIFSSNPLVMRLFSEEGIPVRSPAMYARELHSGTEIRRRILKGEQWENLVPAPVSEIIREIGGVERVRQIARNDCDVTESSGGHSL
ncbi:MAG TPA: nicotinamide-nucleotide adenylyltransferase [Methanoregulaceae archaeon]|nr:nicotinamide-nucleotide adenylyltransferase [Methanoregulaceae archaeon]HQA79833.1 nicotinamide-nucleotide adenylyltransferase [Methanoregulaceae archaeon]